MGKRRQTSGAPQSGRPKPGLMVRLVTGTTGAELIADVQARCDDPQDPAPDADWQTEARVAADFGLLVLAGAGSELTVARTEFGDVWAAAFDPTDPLKDVDVQWPLPGPGKFDVHSFPLSTRPTFSVFALTGPTVARIHQDGWNLERGFGQPGSNPVTEVGMRSTLHDGTWVTVLAEAGERTWVPGVRLAESNNYWSIAERLLVAIPDRVPPWRVRPLDVDGKRHDILVLDLDSDALPAGITGPALLAVAQIDNTQITVIGNDPTVELSLTTINAADLLAPPERGRTQ